MGVARMERRQRVVQNALILAAETFAKQLFQLGHIQVKHLGNQAQRIEVLALVFRRAANGFDRERGNRDADMVKITLQFRLWLHMVRIIKDNAALLERRQVPFVRMLVKREQHIRLVAGAQHFARADAHLEDGGTARDRGGNRHERHDFLLAATSQPREKAADGLDAVLRVARNADHHFVDLRYFLRAARRRCTRC